METYFLNSIFYPAVQLSVHNNAWYHDLSQKKQSIFGRLMPLALRQDGVRGSEHVSRILMSTFIKIGDDLVWYMV